MARATLARSSFLLATILIAALPFPAPAQTRPSLADFGATPPWTPDKICAALQWRESRLCNSSFTVEEKCWVSEKGAPEAYDYDMTADMRCKGSVIWTTVSESFPTSPELSFENSMQLWDGSKETWLSNKLDKTGARKFRAGFYARQPDFLMHGTRFYYAYGFAGTFGTPGGQSGGPDVNKRLSTWLREKLATKGATSSLEQRTIDGQEALDLIVTPGEGQPIQIEATFFPYRDFVYRDYTICTHDRPDTQMTAMSHDFHVSEVAQIDGLWMPTKITVHDTIGVYSDRWLIELKSFSSKTPSDDQMKVTFPVGTEVWDSINDEHYLVEAGSKKSYLDYIAAGLLEAKAKQLENKPLVISGKQPDGKDFTTADWKGKVVLVDFWATWCGPCVGEIPWIKHLYSNYHDKGLEIVGVSSDFEAKSLTDFITKNDMPWPQLFDPAAAAQHWWNPLATAEGIRALPTMFLIDKKGVLRAVRMIEDHQQWDELIPKLLAE